MLQEVISKLRMTIPNLSELLPLFTTVYNRKTQNTHSHNITRPNGEHSLRLDCTVLENHFPRFIPRPGSQPAARPEHRRAAELHLLGEKHGHLLTVHLTAQCISRRRRAHRGPFGDWWPLLHPRVRRFALPETKRLLKEWKTTEKYTSEVLKIVHYCWWWYLSFRSKNPLYCSTGSRQR